VYSPRVRRFAPWLCIAMLASVCGAPRAFAQVAEADPAQAASAEHARTLFLRGVELSSQERWAEAEALFRQSHAAAPRASTAYNLTLALLHLGRGREALDLLAELRTQTEGDAAPYRDQLDTMRAHALKLVARVSLEVAPETATLTLDGAAVAGIGRARELVLDPGVHELQASAPGFEAHTLTLHTRAGDQLSETIVLRALPPEPSSPPPVAEAKPEPVVVQPPPVAADASDAPSWPAVTLMVAGGVALATSGVLGGVALSNDTKLTNRCPELEDCSPSERAFGERSEDFALAADVLLLSGIALAASGVLWWMLEADDEAPRVGAVVSPGLAGVAVSQCF
jgi:hypothetical protein